MIVGIDLNVFTVTVKKSFRPAGAAAMFLLNATQPDTIRAARSVMVHVAIPQRLAAGLLKIVARQQTQAPPATLGTASIQEQVILSEHCCGEAGTLALNRPDVSTQVRFLKEEEILKGETQMRTLSGVGAKDNIKIVTTCPACLQGLSRYGEDLQQGVLQADYIVVETTRHILGPQWMTDCVALANAGGIERVLV